MSKSKDVATQFAAEIVEQLKAGTAPWQKPWEAGIPQPPFNPTTGTVYRGINRVLLGGKGFDDPRWMTLKQANEEGYRVKKGSKSTRVVFWYWSDEKKVLDKEGKPVLDAEGNQVKEKLARSRPLLQIYSVFHASQLQTEHGQDLPLFGGKELTWNPNEKAEGILANSGASITHDQGDRAHYSRAQDEIHLPPKEKFPSDERYYATALHELGHWTGHPSRMDREFGPFGSEAYAKEELRAEIASWMVSQELGIPRDPGQHTAYVESWIKVLENNPYEILSACQAAEKMAEYVMGLEQQQQVTDRQDIIDEINSAIANVGRWDDIGAAREANGYAALARGALEHHKDDQAALERLNLAVEVEIDKAAGTGPSFASCLTHLESFQRQNQDRKSKLEGVNNDLEVPPDRNQAERAKADIAALEKVSLANWEEAVSAIGRRLLDSDNQAYAVEFYAIAPESLKEDIASVHRSMADKDIELYEIVTGPEEEALPADKAIADHLLMDISNKCQRSPAYREAYMIVAPDDIKEKILGFQSALAHGAQQKESVFQENTWLNVPFKEKDRAKNAGAKWDRDAKCWYAPEGSSQTALAAWLPREEVVTAASVVPPGEEFSEALRNAGLILAGPPIMDGKIQRVPVANGKPGAKDGAYCGHEDGKPNGWYQNHKTGVQGKWLATGHTLTNEGKAALREEAAATRETASKEREADQQKAMKRAYARWMNAVPVTEHAYLEAKEVEGAALKLDSQGNLLVPGYDLETGRLQTLQYISPTGGKWLEKGCPKKGAAFILDKDRDAPKEVVLIAEGYATGASLHQATGLPVAVAFDAGNLKEATLTIKKKLPDALIVICADNDQNHPSGQNVGVEKAKEAAALVGGKVLVPEFSKDEQAKGMKDFNDLHRSRGLDAVAKVVNQQVHEETLEAEEVEVER